MFKKGLLILCIVAPTLYTMEAPPAKWDDVTQEIRNKIGVTPGIKLLAPSIMRATQKNLGAPGQKKPKLTAVLVYDPKHEPRVSTEHAQGQEGV